MGSADTNILVRLIARDNDDQTIRAEAFLEHGAWVSHLVIAETIWVLERVYGRSVSDQIEILERLLKHESLILEEPSTVASAVELLRSKPSLRFSDCLILESSRKAGHLPLGTFDRNLSKIDGTQKL